MRRTLAIVFAAALAGGAAGAAVGITVDRGHSSSPTLPEAPIVARPASVVRTGAALSPEAIYRADSPAVVVIKDTVTEVVPPTFFTPGGTEQVGALGSGFVVDRRGDIVTNDHVVQGAHDIRVGFSGGGTYPATVVGTDPTTDIAVVRVKAPA
jgi:putative serine protease PepD